MIVCSGRARLYRLICSIIYDTTTQIVKTESAIDWSAFAIKALGTMATLAGGPIGGLVFEFLTGVFGLHEPTPGESVLSQTRKAIVENLKRYETDEITRRVQG